MINICESEVKKMSNEMWEELDYIFFKNKKLAEEHPDLAKLVKLINDSIKLQSKFQKENEKINNEIQELLNNK